MDKYFSLRVSAMLPILATYFVIFYKKKLFLNFDLDFKRHNLSIALELFT